MDKRIKEPCPFCGEKADRIQIRTLQAGQNKIYCPRCLASFDFWGNKQEVIDKWNGRV